MAGRQTKSLAGEEADQAAEAGEKSGEFKINSAAELADAVHDAVRNVLGGLLGSGELDVSDTAESGDKGGEPDGEGMSLRSIEAAAERAVRGALRDVRPTTPPKREEKAAEPETPPEPSYSRLTRAMGWTDD